MEKLRVAVVGCGDFAKYFVNLFKVHPYVEKVFCCDLVKEKTEEYARMFDVEIIPSFEECLSREDVNCVAIFTERHTHAPLVIAALEAGKDVYSAVPMACTPEECKEIIETVKRTKRTYMMGETCIYYPCAMYCKQEMEKGTFGRFVYGESQYFHDLSHFPKIYQEHMPSYTLPPFFYPTHSTAMILEATGAYAVKVTAMGYKDTDPRYQKDANPWGNEFSDEFSLMELSNGGIARVSECRRIGYKSPSSYISGFYGTEGSYQFSNAQHLVVTKAASGVDVADVSDEVNPIAMTEGREDPLFKRKAANHIWQANSFSPIQAEERKRLPDSYRAIPEENGHMASHQFLIDDFCTAVYEGKMPRVNAWVAARYTIPGLIAHRSAQAGGQPMDIPDYGEAPEKL